MNGRRFRGSLGGGRRFDCSTVLLNDHRLGYLGRFSSLCSRCRRRCATQPLQHGVRIDRKRFVRHCSRPLPKVQSRQLRVQLLHDGLVRMGAALDAHERRAQLNGGPIRLAGSPQTERIVRAQAATDQRQLVCGGRGANGGLSGRMALAVVGERLLEGVQRLVEVAFDVQQTTVQDGHVVEEERSEGRPADRALAGVRMVDQVFVGGDVDAAVELNAIERLVLFKNGQHMAAYITRPNRPKTSPYDNFRN